MPRGTILEKLTFGDVLESADQIIAHADALKVITSLPFTNSYLVLNDDFFSWTHDVLISMH